MGRTVKNMYRVFLADNIFSGHHKIYLDTLLAIDSTVDCSVEMEFHQNKFRPKYHLDRNRFIREVISLIDRQNCVECKILHLLYIDNLYTTPLFPNLTQKYKVIGTLHHYPQNEFKMSLLKIFSRKVNKIVVHSEYIKHKLLENNIKNVEVVHYPSFYDYSKLPDKKLIKENLGLPEDKVIFSALGGTRYDKGLDILLESFKYIPNDLKSKVILNIVGREETFNKKFIDEKIQKYGINARVKLGFVSDEEFMSNVLISNYVVLPYRKIFTGNSGPMTEAIRNIIPILGPNYGNIGFLIENYNLGYTFTPENPLSIAKAIVNSIENKKSIKSNYSEDISIDKFKSSYKNLYNELSLCGIMSRKRTR